MRYLQTAHNIVIPENTFLWTEIQREYEKLLKRHSEIVTNSPHLCQLSKPKNLETVFHEKQDHTSFVKTRSQTVNKTDQAAQTRIEQLAFPSPRKLAQLKKQKPFKNFKNSRKSQINRLHRKSLLSVYTCLMNVKPEEKPPEPKQLNKQTEIQIMDNLKNLAKPKQDFLKVKNKKTPKVSKTRIRTPNEQRIKKLSKPKEYADRGPKKWVLTETLKHYKPTPRLCELAKPKINSDNDIESAFKVQPNALTYRATLRTQQLSEPQKIKVKRRNDSEMENPFKIKCRVLKANATNRTKELATPKEYIKTQTKENPYHISKAALKAKASKRIEELAQPKSCRK